MAVARAKPLTRLLQEQGYKTEQFSYWKRGASGAWAPLHHQAALTLLVRSMEAYCHQAKRVWVKKKVPWMLEESFLCVGVRFSEMMESLQLWKSWQCWNAGSEHELVLENGMGTNKDSHSWAMCGENAGLAEWPRKGRKSSSLSNTPSHHLCFLW